MARGKVFEVMLQKDQTDDVLKQLRVGVSVKLLLQEKKLYELDSGVIVTARLQNSFRYGSVMPFQLGPPCEVSLSIHRIAGSRNFPTADVLASRCQLNILRSFRCKSGEASRHAVCVQYLFWE